MRCAAAERLGSEIGIEDRGAPDGAVASGWGSPDGAAGTGTGIGAVFSGIPVGACACGAEGRMASIGPPALGAKGCVRSAQGAKAVVGAF